MAAGVVDDKVKLIVSYGGEIRRCPVSGKARYVGGENRLVKVGMSERLCALRARLAALAGYAAVRIRYAIVEDGLDALHDVDRDGDLWRLVTILYFRSAGVAAGDRCRVRAFLFPADGAPTTAACLRQSASSPALASGHCPTAPANNMGRRRGGVTSSTLLRAQSAGSSSATTTTTTTSGEATATPLERADSGFEALAAIAEEQKRPPSNSSSGAGGTDSGGLEAVAAEPKLPLARACPAAPVLLVPVVAPVVAVFYPVIPVYQCVVLAGVAFHGRCESMKGGLTIKM